MGSVAITLTRIGDNLTNILEPSFATVVSSKSHSDSSCELVRRILANNGLAPKGSAEVFGQVGHWRSVLGEYHGIVARSK